jgi:hypothetical protein
MTTLSGPAALREKTRAQLARDNLLQWIVSAAVLPFIGYFMSAEKFVGTSGDLLAAFFSGSDWDRRRDELLSVRNPSAVSRTRALHRIVGAMVWDPARLR